MEGRWRSGRTWAWMGTRGGPLHRTRPVQLVCGRQGAPEMPHGVCWLLVHFAGVGSWLEAGCARAALLASGWPVDWRDGARVKSLEEAETVPWHFRYNCCQLRHILISFPKNFGTHSVTTNTLCYTQFFEHCYV